MPDPLAGSLSVVAGTLIAVTEIVGFLLDGEADPVGVIMSPT